jgi:cathepsin L
LSVVALLFACSFAFKLSQKEYELQFLRFMHQHGKSYDAEEFPHRFANFKSNLNFISKHNADKTKTFKVAMNKFGDLSNEEFARLYLGVRMNATTLKAFKTKAHHGKVTHKVNAPASFDWRDHGAVTGVKNQEQCGSCWAFSTTGSVEGCHFLAGKPLVSLSEQNLVDCSGTQGDQGCNGGLMTDAMDYIISNGGVDTESSYPYTAEDGTCTYNAANIGSTLKAYTNVASGDETDLLAKVTLGPTSIAIDASQSSFQFYSSGVYSDAGCSTTSLDHGVLAVGWGTDAGTDYWIVKNSWDVSWGQSGYIWMQRGVNMCGVATMATLPNGCA